MPHHLGKHHEALDRLHVLLATVDQVKSRDKLGRDRIRKGEYEKVAIKKFGLLAARLPGQEN